MKSRIGWSWRIATLGILIAVLQAHSNGAERPPSALDRGFHSLYNLDFASAQQQFTIYEQEHPEDPLGAASQAARLLFSELNRMGILDSAFFKGSSLPRVSAAPDATAYKEFESAVSRSESIAQDQLNRDSKDRDALFAVTLDAGLRADYAALIQHRGATALHYTKVATKSAELLHAVCPDCYDSYVATGISRYLLGSLSPPLRLVLRLGGFEGDKRRGIEDLTLAAERGRYLAPFARILLAIAYVRERNPAHARELVAQLHQEFPGNPLFPREMARLDGTGR